MKLVENRLKGSIDNQIRSNQNKNLFLDTPGIFKFTDETIRNIPAVKELDYSSEQFLIDYTADKAIEEFCRVNQYYSFNIGAKEKLKGIYSGLFKNIHNTKISINDISKNHYKNLRIWLNECNSFAEKIYSNGDEEIKPVACSEYSPELQVNILHIDIKQLMQPVLDIGCGSQGHLVNYLRNHGIEVYGIDRSGFTQPYFKTADWLEYKYGIKKWGTIISNLGFSNHFNHHNLREDGNYIEYAKTYMSILNSLKVGGCFHYAPDLPFIEKFLNESQYSVRKYRVNKYDFKTTIIERLKLWD